MAILETAGLVKRFGSFTALDKLDLQVNEGEVFGFIGPNGAGKTTTIRVLLGILRATEGRASVFGKDAWKDAVEIHKRVAYVPGDVSLWDNLTGGEVIDLFIRLRGKYDKASRDRLIDIFDLDPSKKCRTYSKGNRQKIALIAAFASEADLYILDEPTSGLDPLMEHVFQECVREQKEKGKSIFLSSHILSEVEKLCDRVGIIRQGVLVETGTLDDLRHLTRTNMYLESSLPAEELKTFRGVHGVRSEREGLRFQVDTAEVDSVIKGLSAAKIKKLESTPPTLEELFMIHYNEKAGE